MDCFRIGLHFWSCNRFLKNFPYIYNTKCRKWVVSYMHSTKSKILQVVVVVAASIIAVGSGTYKPRNASLSLLLCTPLPRFVRSKCMYHATAFHVHDLFQRHNITNNPFTLQRVMKHFGDFVVILSDHRHTVLMRLHHRMVGLIFRQARDLHQ